MIASRDTFPGAAGCPLETPTGPLFDGGSPYRETYVRGDQKVLRFGILEKR